MKDDESENSKEESNDFDDEEYQDKGKITENNKGECKICGDESDKDHICQRIAAEKLQEPAKN